MKKMILGAAVLAMSATAAVPANAATSVFNENFETGFGKFTPAGKVNVIQGSAYTAIGFSGNAAAQANHYASFGSGDTNPAGGTLLAATINSAATILTRYTLTFAAGVIGTNIDSQFLNVSVTQPTSVVNPSGEVFNQDIMLIGSNNLNTALKQYSFTFDATGPVSLSFLGIGQRRDGADTLLDDVTLTTSAVPEMSTWGMMILGFGVVGGSVRARRRKAVIATA